MTSRMFYLRFLAVAIPAILIVIALHLLDRKVTLQRWQQDMQAQVVESSKSLTADFRVVATDAMLLAEDPVLKQSSAQAMDMMAARFESLARHRPNYQQVRFIDANGMERLRVNSSAAGVRRVPSSELQNKSERDYFREAINLPPAALRLSRLDLNIEHGQIEQPLNPMLRFSVPVTAANGKRLGVVVINYGVGSILEELFQNDRASGMRLMLLNANGAWLGGGEEGDRWGGILAHNRTFSLAHPDAWKTMQSDQGNVVAQWAAESGYGAAMRVVPTDVLLKAINGNDMRQAVSSADPFWLVAAAADMKTIFAPVNERFRVALVLLLVALGLWVFAIRKWSVLKQRAVRAMKEVQKLAKVVEQTTDHVLITEQEGEIDYVNPAFCQATGYEKTELMGQTPRILKSGMHTQDFYQDMWTRIKKGETVQEMFINRRKDGMLYYEEKTISPLLDETGRASYFVSTGKDITQSKVTRLAFYDPLTGLVNRVLFQDRLQHEIGHAQRTHQLIAVMFLDLDGFKAVNDELGHEAGDKLLIEFSRQIGALMRRSDTFARFGGDEFVVLLKELKSPTDAEEVAGKILQTAKGAWEIGGNSVSIGVSIGISFYPTEMVDSGELLKRADQAMYQAKQSGKNRYVIYCDEKETNFQ